MKALIILEQVKTSVVEKKKKKQMSKTSILGLCKLSLYANKSCDDHAVIFSAMIEMKRYVDHVAPKTI